MSEPADTTPDEKAAAALMAKLFSGDDFGGDDVSAPPVHWPALAAEDLADEITELYQWVVQLQHRFPEMVKLPACWYRHNGLAELLSALRDHERASYSDTAAPTSAVAWQMAFRDVENRLRGWLADLRCGGDINYHDQSVHTVTVADTTLPDDLRAWTDEAEYTRQTTAVQAALSVD